MAGRTLCFTPTPPRSSQRLQWVPDPSGRSSWPHNTQVEREVRTVKELCRPSHMVSVDYVAKKARSFIFTAAPIADYEKGTAVEEDKTGKTRCEVATGKVFHGPRYPLRALVFYRVKGDGMASATTKPGLFVGWHLSPGLRYCSSLLVLDYELVRGRNHLYSFATHRVSPGTSCQKRYAEHG